MTHKMSMYTPKSLKFSVFFIFPVIYGPFLGSNLMFYINHGNQFHYFVTLDFLRMVSRDCYHFSVTLRTLTV